MSESDDGDLSMDSSSDSENEGGHPAVGGKRPAVGGKRPMMGGKRPAVGGKRPVVGGKRPAVGGKRPVVGGKRPAVGGKRPAVGGKRPMVAGKSVAGKRPLVSGKRPKVGGKTVPLGAFGDSDDDDSDLSSDDDDDDDTATAGAQAAATANQVPAENASAEAAAAATKDGASASGNEQASAAVQQSAAGATDDGDASDLDLDDDEDEDDDEEAGEQEDGRPQKKKARIRSRFVDDTADVDEEAGESDDDNIEDDADGLIDNDTSPTERANLREVEAAQREVEERHKGKKAKSAIGSYRDRLEDIANRYKDVGEDEDGDDIMEMPERWDDEDESTQDDVSRLGKVPTVNDPKLWMLKCKPGLEKELCISLMQKYFNMIHAGSPINIKSAYTHEGLRGYFYVEAYKADDVKMGCRGIRDLQWFKPVMVPIPEMVETLSVESRAKDVEIGSWARVKRGTYAGDLCKILDKDDDFARVKVVPRMDFYSEEDEDEDNVVHGKTKKKRPPARLLTQQVLEGVGEHVETTNEPDPEDVGAEFLLKVRGDLINRQGYHVRRINIRSLELNVAPSFDELHAYQPKKSAEGGNGSETADAGAGGPAPSSTKMREDMAATQLTKGDNVLGVKGDLKGMLATIVDVLPNQKGRAADLEVLIMPTERKLKEPIKYPAIFLQKTFNEGDHVRVIQGKYKNHTGMVLEVKSKSGTVKLVSDMDLSKPVEVFCHQLVPSKASAADFAGAEDSLGGGKFKLLDLVSLRSDSTTVGVLVKIEQNSGTILTTAGPKVVRAADIKAKLRSDNASIHDMRNNKIDPGVIVKIAAGARKGLEGTVQHLYHSSVFIKSRIAVEHCGMVAVPAKHVKVLGAISDGQGNGGQAAPSGRGGRRRPGGRPRPRPGGGVELPMGIDDANVVIIKGTFKGLVGVITDTTATHVQIQLQSRNKTVPVPIKNDKGEMCIKVRAKTSMSATPSHGSIGGRTPSWGGATPFGGATPMLGGATPLRAGGATPGHATPLHPGGGGATPSHEGGATPSHESSSGGGWDDDDLGGGGSMQNSIEPKDEGGFGSMMPPPPRDAAAGGWGAGAGGQIEESKVEEVQWRMKSVKVMCGGKPAVIAVDDDGSGGPVEILMLDADNKPDNSQQRTVAAGEIERVEPQKDSMVIVVASERRGQKGTLYGIDGEDGIVQLEDDIQIFPITRLAECVEFDAA